jgi:hypothetical protein
MKLLLSHTYKLLLLPILCLASGCATTDGSNSSAKELDAHLVHTVFFWLEDDVSAADQQAFEKDLAHLAASNENVLNFHIGYPAGTDRSVVDGSYDVGYVATFASKAGQDLYQVDPLHTEFVEAHKAIWKKVIVYDTVKD